MFLNMLNEREGKEFLELATIAMHADGVVDAREQAIMKEYRKELELMDYDIQNKEYDEIVAYFKGCAKKVKRSVIIELAGILDSDGEIDDAEQNWIMKLGNDWSFRETETRRMVRWTQDFNDLLEEGYNYINK